MKKADPIAALKALPYVQTVKKSRDGGYIVRLKKDKLTMALHHEIRENEYGEEAYKAIKTKKKPRVYLPQYEIKIRKSPFGDVWIIQLRAVTRPKVERDYGFFRLTTNGDHYTRGDVTKVFKSCCLGEWTRWIHHAPSPAASLERFVLYLQSARPDGDGLIRRAELARTLNLKPVQA